MICVYPLRRSILPTRQELDWISDRYVRDCQAPDLGIWPFFRRLRNFHRQVPMAGRIKEAPIYRLPDVLLNAHQAMNDLM